MNKNMARVVARGEKAKEKLRAKGVKPGKIETSVTRRKKGSKIRVTRTPAGKLKSAERISSGALSEADKAQLSALQAETAQTATSTPPVKTTPQDKPQTLKPTVTPAIPTNARTLVDVTGRQLTPFESAAIQATAGGQTAIKPRTFGQEKTERFVTRREEEPDISALNIQEITQKEVIRRGQAKIAAEQAKLQAIDKKIQTAIEEQNPQTLRFYQRQRAELIERQILESTPSYGKFEPLEPGEKTTAKRILQQFAGIESKGLEFIGTGAEMKLQDIREQIQVSRLPEPLKKYYDVQARVAQGVVRGGVTTFGKDETAAIIGLATVGAGAVVGGVKTLSVVPKLGKVGKVVAKAGEAGLIATGAGIAGFNIATAEDPIKASGEVVGNLLAFATGYETGVQLGTGAVSQTKKGVAALATQLTKGKPLTTTAGRRIQQFQEAGLLSTEVIASPIEEVAYGRITTPSRKGFLTKEIGTIRYGEPRPVTIEQAKTPGFKIDFTKVDYVADPKVKIVTGPKDIVVENIVPDFATETLVTQKGTTIATPKQFFTRFSGDELITYEETAALTAQRAGTTGTAVRGKVTKPTIPKEPVQPFKDTDFSAERILLEDFQTQIPYKTRALPESFKVEEAQVSSFLIEQEGKRFLLRPSPRDSQVFVIEEILPAQETVVAVDVGRGQQAKVVLKQEQKVKAKEESVVLQETIAKEEAAAESVTEEVFYPLESRQRQKYRNLEQQEESVYAQAERQAQREAKASAAAEAQTQETISEVLSGRKSRGKKRTVTLTDQETVAAPVIAESTIISEVTTAETAAAKAQASKIISDSISISTATTTQELITPTEKIIPRQAIIQEALIKPPKQQITPIIDDFKPRKRTGVDTFTPLIRRRGVFSAIGDFPTLEEATKAAKKIIRQSAAASFKITSPRGELFDLELGEEFRPSKKEEGVFVERRRFRIDDPGELGEITFAPRRKPRRKKKMT